MHTYYVKTDPSINTEKHIALHQAVCIRHHVTQTKGCVRHQVVEQEAICNWRHVAEQQAVLDTCD